MSYCYNCFQEHSAPGPCPRCGYDPASDAGKFPQALSHGTILAGQFITGRVLGQGGFGITYLALDNKTGDRVALKEFLPDTMAGRSSSSLQVTAYSGDRGQQFQYGLDCFLDEARTLAKFIGNPNIVGVRSYFQENGTAYFTMDYIEGVSLKALLRERGGRIGWEEAVRLLVPVMEALEAVHRENLVHRDVTPDNIYISRDGQVKLLDFGAARYSLGDRSRSLDVVLKPGYAPKEQYIRRGRQGPYTDVYSVGACFYASITGVLPPEALERMEEDELVPPTNRGVKMPLELEDAILKALEVQAGDRYQTMGEFSAAVRAAADAAKAEQSVQTAVTTDVSESIRPRYPQSVEMEPPVTIYAGPPVEKRPEMPVQVLERPEKFGAEFGKDPGPDVKKSASWTRAPLYIAAAVLALALLVFGITRFINRDPAPAPGPEPVQDDIPSGANVAPVVSPVLPESEAFFLGNSNGNLNNGGEVASHGGWDYYQKYEDGNAFLVRGDGKEIQKVYPSFVQYVNVTDEWIYFIDTSLNEKSGIYRIRLDGSAKELLAEGEYNFLAVTGSAIYAVRGDKNYADDYFDFEYMPLDGGEWEYLLRNAELGPVVTGIAFDQNGIYYVLDYKLFRMNFDGTCKTQLEGASPSDLGLDDGWLYFSDMQECAICRIRTDGTGMERVSDAHISSPSFIIHDGQIYYCSYDGSEYGLSQIDITTGETVQLDNISSPFPINFFQVTDGWIYYHILNTDAFGEYRIPRDGGDPEKLWSTETSAAPESGSEPEPEATPEPEVKPEKQPESKPESEPEPESQPEPEPTHEPEAEPKPSDVYEGETNAAGEPHGSGTMTYLNGNMYTGQWENGKQSGTGTMVFYTGTVYEGKWENGRWVDGTMSFPNGDVFVGKWTRVAGIIVVPSGTMTYANGEIEEGPWHTIDPYRPGSYVTMADAASGRDDLKFDGVG